MKIRLGSVKLPLREATSNPAYVSKVNGVTQTNNVIQQAEHVIQHDGNDIRDDISGQVGHSQNLGGVRALLQTISHQRLRR